MHTQTSPRQHTSTIETAPTDPVIAMLREHGVEAELTFQGPASCCPCCLQGSAAARTAA